MNPIVAKLPLIRRPFYQRDVARQKCERALQERDAALCERDAALRERDAALRERDARILEQSRSVPSADMSSGTTKRLICVLCQNRVDSWLPFDLTPSDFRIRLGTIGSNPNRFSCPSCGAIDRERHLCLFLERLRLMEPVRGGSVLHIAPEPRFREYVTSFDLGTYFQGDLSPAHESIQRVDMQQMAFLDASFDMVICNHSLEHVDDVTAAIREMCRVLKPGGRAVCQTPYAARLSTTFEDPLLQSPADRLFFYGQEDHVRQFGADIEQRLRDGGLRGRLVPHEEILPDIDPVAYGVNEKEPFFDFVRD